MPENIPDLHKVHSVTATGADGVYIVDMEVGDAAGARQRFNYVSAPDDTFGLAPLVRAWLEDNEGSYTVLPHEPPPEVFRPLAPVDFLLGVLTLNIVPEQIDAAIGQMPEPDRTIARIYWTRAEQFKRDDPLIEQIAALFGKTAEDINSAWRYAQG